MNHAVRHLPFTQNYGTYEASDDYGRSVLRPWRARIIHTLELVQKTFSIMFFLSKKSIVIFILMYSVLVSYTWIVVQYELCYRGKNETIEQSTQSVR